MKETGIFQSILIGIFGVAVALGISEAAIRIIDPLRLDAIENQSDRDRKKDINPQGIRSEIETPIEHKGFRVLAMGDSFTYGLSLKTSNTWPVQTEAVLRKKYPDIEVLNGGRPSLDTRGELELFRRVHSKLNPDMLLVGFLLNDCTQMCSNCGPVKIKKQVEKLVKNPTGIEKYFELFHFLHVGLMKRELTEKTITSHLEPYEIESEPYKECTQAFVELKEEALKRKMKLAVIIYPMLFRLTEGEYPFAAAHEKVLNFLKSIEVDAYDLTPSFLGIKDTQLWVKKGDSHPNASANKIAAEKIAEIIEGYIPKPPTSTR